VSTIVERAETLREQAGAIKRYSDLTLYRILSGVLELCEANPIEQEELRRAYADKPLPEGKNRTYVEKGSDIYQLACRYIFHGAEHRANVNRYAIALRRATERQLRSHDLIAWLAGNGGINALYVTRPLDREVVKTKCLRLDVPITVTKGQEFTLRLIRTPENSYRVLSMSERTTDPS
jgi:hypothetical protein